MIRTLVALGLVLSVIGPASSAEAQDTPSGSTVPPRSSVEPGQVLGVPDGSPRTGQVLAEATEAVAAKLRCPVCQGLSVAASHTDTALAMKSEIEALLAEGFSEEQVLSWFEASYGEFIRLEPKAEGFNLLVWITPVVAILLGFGLIVWRSRTVGRARASKESVLDTPEPDEPGTADDPGLQAYLEQVRREAGS